MPRLEGGFLFSTELLRLYLGGRPKKPSLVRKRDRLRWMSSGGTLVTPQKRRRTWLLGGNRKFYFRAVVGASPYGYDGGNNGSPFGRAPRSGERVSGTSGEKSFCERPSPADLVGIQYLIRRGERWHHFGNLSLLFQRRNFFRSERLMLPCFHLGKVVFSHENSEKGGKTDTPC